MLLAFIVVPDPTGLIPSFLGGVSLAGVSRVLFRWFREYSNQRRVYQIKEADIIRAEQTELRKALNERNAELEVWSEKHRAQADECRRELSAARKEILEAASTAERHKIRNEILTAQLARLKQQLRESGGGDVFEDG